MTKYKTSTLFSIGSLFLLALTIFADVYQDQFNEIIIKILLIQLTLICITFYYLGIKETLKENK